MPSMSCHPEMPRPIQVLLVEDDPVQCKLMALLLRAADDFAVTAADNGLEGLERAWTARPDVIVLDLMLPGISGLELLRRYRRERGCAGVLVVTGASGENVAAAAIAAGADFVLTKPVIWGELVRCIRLLAGGLSRQCEDLLVEMGAPPHGAGTRQAARCAGTLGGRREVQMKEVYLETARAEGTSPACVEKNVRRLVETLEKSGGPAFRALFNADGGRPSNSVFLRGLVREVRRRMEEEEN